MTRLQSIYFLFLLVIILCEKPAAAQSGGGLTDHDTLYVQTFPKTLTTSLFLAQNFVNFEMYDMGGPTTLTYEPNSLLGLGAGVSAKWLTVSFAYGFKFLNPDLQEGTTKSYDFQTHIYTRKFVIDLFAEFYKGMYLENTRELNPQFDRPYYLRPDLDEEILGLSGYYIFNHRRYSFPAALVQSERQLHSAGSFLLGFEMYAGRVRADSAFAPNFSGIDTLEVFAGYDGFGFLKFGPSVGYAYTLVVAKRLYLTASLSLNINAGGSRTHHIINGPETDFKMDVGAFARFGMGYNTYRWCLSLNGVYNYLSTQRAENLPSVGYGISQVKIQLIHRFDLGDKLESHIDKVRVPFAN